MSHTTHSLRKEFLAGVGLDSSKESVQIWGNKYNSLKQNAKNNRGCICDITFEQYVNKAIGAGILDPHQIGRGLDKYQMGRIGDIGDYTVYNCRFITQEQNLKEEIANGGKASADAKLRGRRKETHQGVANQAMAITGRTAESHEYLKIMSDKKRGRRKDAHEDLKRMSIKISKGFELTDPLGNIHRGINLKEFCEANDLNQGAMANTCRGGQKQHKGWTGIYIDKETL